MMPGRGEAPKCPNACNYCRNKKAKCTGTFPCSNCVAHQEVCSFPETGPRSKKRKVKEALLEERLGRVEALLNQSLNESPLQDSVETPQLDSRYSVPINQESSLQCEQASRLLSPPASNATVHYGETGMPNIPSTSPFLDRSISEVGGHPVPNRITRRPSIAQHPSFSAPRLVQHTQRNVQEMGQPLFSRSLTSDVFQSMAEKPCDNAEAAFDDAATGPVDEDYPEHHGTFSYLSICSKPGIDWISAQTRSSMFFPIARNFALMVARNLKMNKGLPSMRIPDPDLDTAQKWSTAFFNDSAETPFANLSRPAFEKRLRDHYLVDRIGGEDTAWYALRNVVFAIGYRVSLSEAVTKDSFQIAHVESWRYFQNAMSVHTDLLYTRQDITAIQALFLMSLYTEGIGSPALEYGLLSCATRLAQSKGLHMYQRNSSRISEGEKSIRIWLWWCIYIFEKHIACRSGRPSAICDEDVSCQIPTSAPPGVTADVNFFISAIKHAQLSSLITQRLSSARASQFSRSEARETVRQLEKQLTSWWSNLDPIYRTRPSLRALKQHPNISINHVMYLYLSYHGSLCAIHSVFTCPWSKENSHHSQDAETLEQIHISASRTAESSREIIMVLQQVEINVTAPTWLIFYYPIVSLINLFIYVLRDVTAASTSSDLSLMEVVIGHFSRLEYASGGEMTIAFAREATNLARKFVSSQEKGGLLDQSQTRSSPGAGDAAITGFNDMSFPLYDQYVDLDGADFLLDDLPIFMPPMNFHER